ncbi:anion permease [Pseudonocardia sp. C8]|uniref:SLC13 family permease n=1 Tax=Pseudonocardia sp. C8 TaxID=2762759 RepID=UPI0016426849|nr:SLC13 family permease [Pseudonocardia sp. C8]MBC3193858.1 anion permease [Pseudonocardia sp. C8]
MTAPTLVDAPPPAHGSGRRRTARPALLVAVVALVLVGGTWAATGGPGALPAGLSVTGAVTLSVFLVAVGLWAFTRVDETYVALGAATLLTLAGALEPDTLFGALGDETIWLLVAAFVLAAGVRATGLSTRAAVALVSGARSPRGLAHRVAFAVFVTAFAVPSTSARAAVALPVFTAVSGTLGADAPDRRLRKALALLFPSVILLSAVATLTGAGAHLVTSQVLHAATGAGIGFGRWLLLGVPLAVVSTVLTAELVLTLFTRRDDRRRSLRVDREAVASAIPTPVTGPLTGPERRALIVLAAVTATWSTESWHGIPAALAALAGALVLAGPRIGTTSLEAGLRSVPWSLLVFMAATGALGAALVGSGAGGWLAGVALGGAGAVPGPLFITVVIALSALAHLVLASRTARSSVLIPLLVPAAVAAGLDPVAVAFASTAAAGFCHTLPSSAKPVAMFARVDGVPTYDRPDLLRLSAGLGPLTVALVLVFSLAVWPLLGLPLR